MIEKIRFRAEQGKLVLQVLRYMPDQYMRGDSLNWQDAAVEDMLEIHHFFKPPMLQEKIDEIIGRLHAVEAYIGDDLK